MIDLSGLTNILRRRFSPPFFLVLSKVYGRIEPVKACTAFLRKLFRGKVLILLAGGCALSFWQNTVFAADEVYLLFSDQKSCVKEYCKQGLKAELLAEDTVLVLQDGQERIFPAGSFIMREGEEVPQELMLQLQSEATKIASRDFISVALPESTEEGVTQELKRFDFEDVLHWRLPNFSGARSMPEAWLDGERYLQRRYCQELGRETLCVIDAWSGKVLGPLVKDQKWLERLREFPAFEKKDNLELSVSRMDSKFEAIWFSAANDLYYVKLDGSLVRRLTDTPVQEELVSFSPDGRFLAYISENNLYVVDVEAGTPPRAIMADGSETILNGKCSWVYFEEVYGRNWKGYWWSPDSRKIIFYRTDESMVPVFTLIDETEDDQKVIQTRYPRAGEPNPRVTLAVAEIAGGNPRFISLRDYDPENYLITRAGFTAQNRPWYIIQDRAQKWLDFWIDGVKQFRDSTPAWIEPPLGPLFLQDGSWIGSSTRDGFNHLYFYGPEGKGGTPEGVQLTFGEWEVRHLIRADEEGKWVYFTATRDNLIAENFYRVNWETQKIERLTPEKGNHQISLSPDCRYFADTWSNRQNPGQSVLRQTQGAAKVRMLHLNPVYERSNYLWGKSEQFSITLADGYEMEVGWILPPDFDPQKKYPVWMSIYGGPEMPSLNDSWGGGRTSDQSLAAEGVIVFYADPRVASGKGASYAWPCYRGIYLSEGEDLAEAIRWLGEQPFVDKERIGLSGYSYGGSMTLWMMTRYDLFCAGIAGGSVTCEREYDTIYTERYMDTPQNNPEGYKLSSVLEGAENLHGRLLLVLGMLDDNVHPCNSWKFAHRLQNAQIQFELMAYPRTKHAYAGAHHYQLMRDFIRRNLKLVSETHPE